jgi:hypothetical protein
MTPLLERHFHVTLIELVVLQVTVVVARRKAHLVRLATLDKGGGTDCSDVLVDEGDNALGGAAGEMRRRALIVKVVGGPTEPAGSVVRALPAVVTRIFTVAREAIGERRQLAFAEYRSWRSAWLFHLSSLEAIFAFAILWTSISGSLSSVEVGDDARWGRGGSLLEEVRVEACTNGGVSEISLHDVFLLFRLALDGVELDPLPLDVSEARILCTEGVDVRNDTCVSKVEQRVVDYEAIVRRRIEDGEISVSQS